MAGRIIGLVDGNKTLDEILLHAKLSPVKRTGQLDDEEIQRLYEAVQSTLVDFADRMRVEIGDGFPEKVTAFRKDMGVHGKYGEPCPVCGSPVQRIVYAENEANYCPTCQTGGKLLADRSLSRLLHADWPRTVDELEGRPRPRERSGADRSRRSKWGVGVASPAAVTTSRSPALP